MKRLLLATLLIATSTLADSLSHEESDALAAEAARLAPAAGLPVIQTLPPVPEQYSTLGLWGEVISWTPHIPVTCAQLPDGRLLTFASSERTTFPAGTFTYAATWDYRTGEFVEINNPRHDMFCGGVSLLPDGRLLVSGGNSNIRESSMFDWRTNVWSAEPDMKDTRWYNTSIALPNGTVLTASGSGGSDTAERWQESLGWTRLSGINWAPVHGEGGFESIWHPFLHVAPDGRIAHTGPTRTMHWVDPTGSGQLTNTSTTIPGSYYPKDGAVVMFNEGKILHAAGRSSSNTGGASRLAYVIDINGSTPVITQTSSLLYARTFANGVVLPNGEVMAIGGNTSQEKFNDTGSALTPEIWNPGTGRWRKAAAMQVPRNYHSLAVLLPDGRVWSGGGGLSGTATDHQDAQIYTPAILFNTDGTPAARPAITETPAAIGPGMTFAVRATAGMQRFTFIKLAALTHSVCSDLRFLDLPFTEQSPGRYAVHSHANLNVMTPGYWMMFAISPDGPYSESKIIRVAPELTHSISNPADQVTTVGSSDSLTIIASGHSATSRVFTATGLPEGVTIDPSTGVISGTTTATGFYNVVVNVDDAVIEPASTSFQWNVHSDLKLTAPTNAPVPLGVVLSLTASSTGSASPEFKWDFGDGSPDTGFSSSPTITHNYSSPGRYLVTLTARDDTGSWVTTSFFQAVHATLTNAQPTVSSSIAYQVRSGANARLWVVNPDQDNVTVFDAVKRTRSGIISTGKGPRSVAIAPDGRAWVVNSESGSISIIGTNLVVAQTVPLPRGSRPHAIVFDPAGANAYVSLQDSGAVLKINPASPLQVISTAVVGSDVRYLSVSADGTKIFATRFITPRLPGEETAEVITQQDNTKFGGEVIVIAAASMSITKTIILEHNDAEDSSITARGIPNYLGPAVLSPDGSNAWVPSKQDNIKRGVLRDGKALTHDSAVRSIASRIDLTTETEDFDARIDFNDAGIASTAAYERTGMYLFTAIEGSREIAVVDAWGKRELLRFTAGRAPQGVVTSPDGRTLYVHNLMDRTVTVHDVSAILNGAETPPALTATLKCIVTETLRWENLDMVADQSLARGMVRLKVQHTTTGDTAATAAVAWQQVTVQSGTQTVGVNVVNAPVFAGYAHSSAQNTVFITDASYLPGVADPDARYYLEIRSGSHAGHHFDLDHVGDRALVIDAESANNTLAEVPADIAGARIAIHKHITLGQVFDKTVLKGTNSPSTADQVLVYTSNSLRSFWLLKAGSYHQWNAAGDATLASADATIIPPGTGVLLKTSSSVARSLVFTGQVRITPFARLVAPGYGLFANPWPLDASPSDLNMTDTALFTPTTNPSTADAFQLWKGDSQPGASGYNGFWFFKSPSAPALWTSSGDASLRSQNDLPLFKATRAAFLNRRGTTTSVWVIPAP